MHRATFVMLLLKAPLLIGLSVVGENHSRVHDICQTWPAKFWQILLRTDTRLVFCNRKLMRTDIFFSLKTTKPICNFVNPSIHKKINDLFTVLQIFANGWNPFLFVLPIDYFFFIDTLYIYILLSTCALALQQGIELWFSHLMIHIIFFQ